MLDTTEQQTLTTVLCSLRILKQSSYHTWCCVIGDLAFSRDSGFLGSNCYHLEFPNECLFIDGGPLEKYIFEPLFLWEGGCTEARMLEWVAIPFSRISSWPRD